MERTIAAAVAAARREARLIAPPAGWPAADIEAAMRIQEAASDAMGEQIAGWKVGATSPESQKIMGADQPFYGPLFAPRVHASGATVSLAPGTLGVECEYAFLIGSDQTPGRTDYDADSISTLVASCHPALEIAGRRVSGDSFPTVVEAAADLALNIDFVHGPAIANWQDADLADTEVKGFADGKQTNSGFGRNVLGHPLNSLAWFANTLAARGMGLKAGDWVSTGTCLGVVPAAAGSRITGDYGDLGRVEVTFAAD